MDYDEHRKLSGMMVEMLNRLFYDADIRMLERLDNADDFCLSIPHFLNRHFQEAFQNYSMISGAVIVFRGITIVPAQELEITLFHKDYPLYKEEWMIRKIPLANPWKSVREWYTEYVIALHEAFSYFEKDNSELN